MQTSKQQSEGGESASSHAVQAKSGAPLKMPVGALLLGVAGVLGISGWTAVRVRAALASKHALETKRGEEQQRAAATAAQPQSARWVQGKPERWQPSIEFEGTLLPLQAADLSFKQGGRIQSVRVKLGDVVTSGRVLATLDAREAAAQLQAAGANVRAAEAQLALAKDSQSRTEKLVESGSVAQARGVESAQQQALAQAQLEAARANLGLAQVSLGNHTLVAPFTGTVTKVPEGIGAVVSPATVLFSLADLSKLKLRGTLSEQDGGLVAPGANVEVMTEHGSVQGKLSAVIGVMDASTRRIPVEAIIDNKGPGALRAGVFVRARAAGAMTIDVLRFPRGILRPGSQDEAFAINDGRLESRRILFETTKDGDLLVRSGLSAKDHVVLGPRAEAAQGERVEAEPTGATP